MKVSLKNPRKDYWFQNHEALFLTYYSMPRSLIVCILTYLCGLGIALFDYWTFIEMGSTVMVIGSDTTSLVIFLNILGMLILANLWQIRKYVKSGKALKNYLHEYAKDVI